KSLFKDCLALLIVSFIGCDRTMISPPLTSNANEGHLDGIYSINSLNENCTNEAKLDIKFAPLIYLDDSVTVEVKSTPRVSGKIGWVCLTYTKLDKDSEKICIDLQEPKFSWVNGELWWTPVVRQHFPYVLGVDRSWVKGRIFVDKEDLVISQERTHLQAGILAIPKYYTDAITCRLRAIPLLTAQ
ncbi:MAG: hypothetical protein KDD55_05110, partial [Bdellovibrionales bacterium]|nr:hypothetical protein [Bdellovibrionales bacterium]